MNQDQLTEKTIGFDQIETEYGICRRRVRRMINSGLIFPSVAHRPFGGKSFKGEYHRHLFSKSDLLEIIIISELLSQGFRSKKVQAILEYVRHNSQQLSGELYQTDGRTIWPRDFEDNINDQVINPDLPPQTVFLRLGQIQQKIGELNNAN